MPQLSRHFASRQPSPIRWAQIEFLKRNEDVEAINLAIGNISLPMHPAMIERMFNLDAPTSPFKDWVNKYTATVGTPEANKAMLNIIAASGFNTDGLFCQITDWWSAAMELVLLWVCGDAGTGEKPALLIDPAYTNYVSFADRIGRNTVSIKRTLQDDGKFSIPDMAEIEKVIAEKNPGAMVIIPYDNPTGQLLSKEEFIKLCKICVKNDLWIISDEAYREFIYNGQEPISIWGITESEVPGITGRRISIETASKVWNACGLRIWAIVTDNKEFSEKSVAEYTANLNANSIGQYIFAALGDLSKEELNAWFAKQRKYYEEMILGFTTELTSILPGVIVSSPDASLYSVIDVRNLVKPGFNAMDFVMYCARKWKVEINGKFTTLLVAPMTWFYAQDDANNILGQTQMRVAYVETPETMKKVPTLFKALLEEFESQR